MLLTQHLFAVAESHLLQCSGFHQSSHLNPLSSAKTKLSFRCEEIKLLGRGTNQLLLTQHTFAFATMITPLCKRGHRTRDYQRAWYRGHRSLILAQLSRLLIHANSNVPWENSFQGTARQWLHHRYSGRPHGLPLWPPRFYGLETDSLQIRQGLCWGILPSPDRRSDHPF